MQTIPTATSTAETPLPSGSSGPEGRLMLGLGTAALMAGCYIAIAMHEDRVYFLILFGISIALFATTLALALRRLRTVIPPAVKDEVSPALPAQVQRVPTLPLLAAKPVPASPPVPTPVPPSVAVPEPGPVSSNGDLRPPVAKPQAKPLPVASLDVATLMHAPLSDLLLAALLKDPQETRRIFAQASPQSAVQTPSDGVDPSSPSVTEPPLR